MSTLLSLKHHFQPPAGAFDPDRGLAWWKFKRLAKLVDQDFANRITLVRATWSGMEERLLRDQASLEAQAINVWYEDRDAAQTLLTSYTADVAAEANSAADRLAEKLR